MQQEMSGGRPAAAAAKPPAKKKQVEVNLDEAHRMATADHDFDVELTEEDMNDPELLVCNVIFPLFVLTLTLIFFFFFYYYYYCHCCCCCCCHYYYHYFLCRLSCRV